MICFDYYTKASQNKLIFGRRKLHHCWSLYHFTAPGKSIWKRGKWNNAFVCCLLLPIYSFAYLSIVIRIGLYVKLMGGFVIRMIINGVEFVSWLYGFTMWDKAPHSLGNVSATFAPPLMLLHVSKRFVAGWLQAAIS